MVNLKDFEIANRDKWDRAINGADRTPGVGEGASDMEKLAAYDKLGGLIKKDGKVVKTGSFYDLENRKPRETPEIVYVFYRTEVPGSPLIKVEIPEGEDTPLEVVANEAAKKRKGRPRKKELVDDDE